MSLLEQNKYPQRLYLMRLLEWCAWDYK